MATAEIAYRQAELELFIGEVFGPEQEQDDNFKPAMPVEPLDRTDEELLSSARRAENGARFAQLFDAGDWKSAGFPSQSEADLALCGTLAFWTQRDKERMDRLFRRSGLYRKKWDRRDYRNWTLNKAVAECRDSYKPPKHRPESCNGCAPTELESGFSAKPSRASSKETVRLADGKLPEIVAQILKAMREDGGFFDRGGEIVGISNGRSYSLSVEGLQVRLTDILRFEKYDKRADKWLKKDCPKDLAKTLLAVSEQWALPPLRGVITAPTITPAGRVIETSGYDKETGLFLDLTAFPAWPGIPVRPTDGEAEAAAKVIWHPFEDFPFESPVDRGGYLSGLLTVTCRRQLQTAPGILIPSPQAGTGKTLLARSLSRFAGCEGEVLPNIENDDSEMRKRLVSVCRAGSPVIILDNVSGSFKSEALCAFLTTERMGDRILGSSTMVSVRTNSMVIINGVNPIVLGDLNRRLIRARINPRCEKPYLRTFALNPVEYVSEHRAEMVRAALLILKASIVSGFYHNKGRLASFEIWSDLIRNAVIWIGERGWLDVADPVQSIEEGYELDPETRRLQGLLAIWLDRFGAAGSPVSKAIERAGTPHSTNPTIAAGSDADLWAVLNDVSGERGILNSRRLSRWIETHEGRIVSGCHFERAGTWKDRVLWAVRDGRNGRLGRFPYSYAGKCQNDTYIDGGKNTVRTDHSDRLCKACVNFAHPGADPETAPGICERTHGGRPSMMATDGVDCPAFERITH